MNGVVYFDLTSREGVPKTYRCTVDAPPVVMNSAIMHDGTIKGYEFTEDRVSYYKCGAGITDGFYEADTITGEKKLIKEFSMTLPYGHAVYQGQYIYLEELIPDQTEYADHQNDQHFYVFDRNYEMIASSVIPFEHKRQYPAFMAATDDRMLFSIHLFPQKYDYYIDKSDIASGNIIWREAA